MPCNINLNFTDLQNTILGQVGTLINLKGLIGTPPGLAALQGALSGALASIQGGLGQFIPDIPFGQDFLNLRDTLGNLASGLESDIGGFLDKFGGAVNINGNINLLDLANSAIRLGANFDPCALASSIPNIAQDAAGNFFEGPSLPPFKGATDFGQQITLARQSFTDVQSTVNLANTAFSTVTDLSSGIDALKNNTVGSLTGMGDMVRKLPNGAQEFVTQASFIDELKTKTATLREVNMPKVDISSTGISIQA